MSSIDHLTIRLADLTESGRFYRQLFELLEFAGTPHEGGGFLEWNDFSIAQADPEHPPTSGLHVGFTANSRAQVDAWWQTLTQAGYTDDGQPGPRRQYSPDYYGAFVRDPGGNSTEAVHNPPRRNHEGTIDHIWLRFRDLDEAATFYKAIAPVVGLELHERPERVHFRTDGASFNLVQGSPSANVHLAFGVNDQTTVQDFHRTALDAGAADNGGPGERPQYHPGYYGAYALDPGRNNIEAVFHNRDSNINV
jgi:catechol 2,3-dioxygenase-like lactoylglutathione lyase family enzyme